MKNVLTTTQKRLNEKEAMSGLGYTEDILIENAAAAFLRAVTFSRDEKITVIAGCGNNGADALSIARMLFTEGYKVCIVIAGDNPNINVQRRLNLCRALSIPVLECLPPAGSQTVIIDGIFGIGLSRPLSEEHISLINEINSVGAKIISIDVPSGLNADTGRTEGGCVCADITVALGSCAVGLLINDAPDYTGEITVADIGLVAESEMKLLTDGDVKPLKRRRSTHKYHYGKVVIIGGSKNMPGAAQIATLTARAALKGGAGLVVTALPDCLFNVFPIETPESMYAYLKSKDGCITFDETELNALTEKTSAIAVGMGMPPNDDLKKIIFYLAAHFDGTLILDAGALTALGKDAHRLKNLRAKIILTPHAGEFERLSTSAAGYGHTVYGNNSNLPIYERIRLLAEISGTTVLYKSAYSIISDGRQTVFNTSGTPAMAKGGTGDALSGLIAARAYRTSPFRSAYESAFILGKAGERAETAQGTDAVMASEIIPSVF